MGPIPSLQPPEDHRVVPPTPNPSNQPVLAAIALAGLASAILLVMLAERFQTPMPFCGLRRLTGVPCPGCGSIRSLLAWAELQPLDALQLNPLLFSGMIGITVWSLAQLLNRRMGARLNLALSTLGYSRWFVRIVMTSLVLNWLYLCLTLPK